MKFKQFLNEEYYNSYIIGGKTIEVFLNPTPSEFKMIGKAQELRGILDKKGDLFIWLDDASTDEWDKLVHEPVMRKLNKSIETGTIPIKLYPKKKRIELSYYQKGLSQQEVERQGAILRANENIKKYMGGKFKLDLPKDIFDNKKVKDDDI